MSSMFAPPHSSSSSCSHPTPLTLTSSRFTTSSRPTTQITLPDQNTTASITQHEDYGPLAKTPPSNRFWAQRDRHFWWVRGYSFILPELEFRHYLRPWRQRCGVYRYWDWRRAHRNALALPLFSQESEAEAHLRQTYHFNAEGLFKGAPSILARTGQPVVWLTQKRKCSQDLDDSKTRIMLGRQKEQLLAGAKSEILEHEYKADHAENQIRALKSQIESHALEIGHTFARDAQSRREQDLKRVLSWYSY